MQETPKVLLQRKCSSQQIVYDLSELLFQVYNPFFMRSSDSAFPGGNVTSEAEYNEYAIDEENKLIYQLHKHILSYKPNETPIPTLYSDFVMTPFKRAILRSTESWKMRRMSCINNSQVQLQEPRESERQQR